MGWKTLFFLQIGLSVASSVFAMIAGGVKNPSNWISLAGALTVGTWYIINLCKYKDFVQENKTNTKKK